MIHKANTFELSGFSAALQLLHNVIHKQKTRNKLKSADDNNEDFKATKKECKK
jgi:hypothetical protein